MLVFDKPWLICKNGKDVARVIINHSDMRFAANPRNSDEESECTICLWNGYESLSDMPEKQTANLQQQMRTMLQLHLHKHPDDYAAKFALQENSLSLLYMALQKCEDLAVQLLAVKKVDERCTLLLVDDPVFADGLIYAAQTGPVFHNREEATYWKKSMMLQLRAETHAYDLYLRGSVFDVTIEYWKGEGDAKEHLEDGKGFDQKNQMGFYFEMFDPYNERDTKAIEQQIYDMFL